VVWNSALVQFWLSRISNGDPKHPDTLFQNRDKAKHYVIDGKWGNGSVQAVKKFQKLYAADASDWISLVPRIFQEFTKQSGGSKTSPL